MSHTVTASSQPTERPATPSARFGRVGFAGLFLLVALLVIGGLAMVLGVTEISPAEAAAALFTDSGDRITRIVVRDVRLPRFLLGALGGAALAVAGAMLQDALRNELAAPGLLGVSTGASLMVAIVVIFHVAIPAGTLPLFALAGGLIAGFVILIATRLTHDPIRMILIGAALSALFGSLITVTVVLGDPNDVRSLYSFLVGSLTGRDWSHLQIAAPWIALALPAALFFGRMLNLLQLGDDIAEGLGLPVFRTRAAIFTIAILLTAAVVAVCGPIGFVALIVPHMTRGLLGSTDARQVLPIAALMGAAVLAGADLLARELFSPAELPVGLVTVVIGSPIALYLLRRLIGRRHAV